MRLRVRGPSGQSTLTLADDATVADLQTAITSQTSVFSFQIKYGFPPKPLVLDTFDGAMRLDQIGVKLNGEQLIIDPKEGNSTIDTSTSTSQSIQTSSKPQSQTITPNAPAPPAPLQLQRNKKPSLSNDDAPEIPVPDYGGTMVLRVMEDDNSCLFRAIGTCVCPGEDMMVELRSIIASAIHSDPETYTAVVLEKPPADYARWIMTPDAWGGAIELAILADHFGIEICSIDVQSLRVDKYNSAASSSLRCFVVYSGIHYDAIAISPSDPPHTHADLPAEMDIKQFSKEDPVPLDAAVQLCQVLQGRKYYTDTARFSLMCKDCGTRMNGEREATQHAMATGHMNFGEE